MEVLDEARSTFQCRRGNEDPVYLVERDYTAKYDIVSTTESTPSEKSSKSAAMEARGTNLGYQEVIKYEVPRNCRTIPPCHAARPQGR